MIIPFVKAHGAKNDFLLTWTDEAPASFLEELAIAICDRHTGIGADGWMLVQRQDGSNPAAIRLFNSDGSAPEISGNGTRCAAALLVEAGHCTPDVPIRTGAGLKHLRLIDRNDNRFSFEMNMGRPVIEEGNLRFRLPLAQGTFDATILDVGNPQCAIFVDDFPPDWSSIGAEVERHPHFPNRTNVSFVRVKDEHTVEVRFFERGAGETMSSGTGSTGAAAAAAARGLVQTPVTIVTPAGELAVAWKGDEVFLTGPSEIVGQGSFRWTGR